MLALVAVLIGGIVELVPTLPGQVKCTHHRFQQPYTPLELQGRDIYVREGVIPVTHKWSDRFRNEVVRYKRRILKSR